PATQAWPWCQCTGSVAPVSRSTTDNSTSRPANAGVLTDSTARPTASKHVMARIARSSTRGLVHLQRGRGQGGVGAARIAGPSRASPEAGFMAETVRHLTGITTTGTPHLGNYVGAIRPAIAASRAPGTEAFF